MNWPASIDWLDIGLHVLFAGLWAAGAAVGFDQGRTYGRASGWILAVLSVASLGAVLFFWPVRELDQHGGAWGGGQSQLEWIVPNFLAVLIFTGTAWGLRRWRA